MLKFVPSLVIHCRNFELNAHDKKLTLFVSRSLNFRKSPTPSPRPATRQKVKLSRHGPKFGTGNTWVSVINRSSPPPFRCGQRGWRLARCPDADSGSTACIRSPIESFVPVLWLVEVPPGGGGTVLFCLQICKPVRWFAGAPAMTFATGDVTS